MEGEIELYNMSFLILKVELHFKLFQDKYHPCIRCSEVIFSVMKLWEMEQI